MSHLRVLVVDDETLIRWSVVETLTKNGHRVLEADNASTAVRALTETDEPIDVVLLDCRLPDCDDLHLLRDVKRLRPDSVVVLMTAFGTPEFTQDALELGAFCVLNKPFDMHGLESLVRRAHSARSSRASSHH